MNRDIVKVDPTRGQPVPGIMVTGVAKAIVSGTSPAVRGLSFEGVVASVRVPHSAPPGAVRGMAVAGRVPIRTTAPRPRRR